MRSENLKETFSKERFESTFSTKRKKEREKEKVHIWFVETFFFVTFFRLMFRKNYE